MSDNLELLLQPVSEELPCGEDLEYDPDFQEMERAAQGKPETQFSEAEPPEWQDVQKYALKVLNRSRDIRALVMLARAGLQQGDWPLFGQCIAIIPQWLEQYWDHVHPQLDPDDQDPEFRVNSIAALAQEPTQFNDNSPIREIREASLVSSPAIGQFSLRDIEIATGKLDVTLPEGEEPPSETTINAAFSDCPAEQLEATAAAINSALEGIEQCDAILTDKLGAAQAPDLSAIIRELKTCRFALNERMAARGLGTEVDTDSAIEADDAAPAGTASAAAGSAQKGLSGVITDRADVVRALDMISDYYRRNEPSSPIPFLMERAKRLSSKDFFDIMQELSPNSIAELDNLLGRLPEES